jgi:hypothetical protein
MRILKVQCQRLIWTRNDKANSPAARFLTKESMTKKIEESAELTQKFVEEIKERLNEFKVEPMRCSECSRPFFILQWKERPTFKTEGIMFLVNDDEFAQVSIANMKDKLTCSIHKPLEGGPAQ